VRCGNAPFSFLEHSVRGQKEQDTDNGAESGDFPEKTAQNPERNMKNGGEKHNFCGAE
jgi:hypothetical protein